MKGSYAGKIFAVILAPVIITINHSHAQSGGYVVTERGADWKVLQKTTVESGTNRIHKYVELATGLNYTNSYNQLVESKEEITLLPTGGAAATQGQHKVYFPADIYNGVLEVVTPDGQHLRSRPLGVSYDDGSNTVFIATLKPAIGYLVSSNQVVYPNAFTGFKADLVCTYRRGGFESDLVFRQQPPAPGDYGLDADWSTLQMVTEFFNTPDPEQIPAASDEWYGLEDSTLKFGRLSMTKGHAFAMNPSATNLVLSIPGTEDEIPVYKRWLHLDSRTFLVEEVPVEDLADDLDALPLTASTSPGVPKDKTLMASGHWQLPPFREIVADTNQMLMAAIDLNREPGVVLDYNEINTGLSDFTFQADTTYYISGGIYLYGTNIFEGGAVIKFGSVYLGIVFWDGAEEFMGASYRPTVFTSMNDNTVGETISGSTGNPGVDYYVALEFDGSFSSRPVLSNVRLKYAYYPLRLYSTDAEMRDSQILNCAYGINNPTYQLNIYNCLLTKIEGSAWDGNIIAQNVTVDQCYDLGGWGSLYATNCIFADVTNASSASLGGNINGFYKAAEFGANAITNTFDPFQIGAAAGNYLAVGCPFRDAGTTAINAELLAELQTMTTCTPQEGGFPDTNAPDLGYHYPVNEDSDYDGLPDWWELKYFGNYNQTGTGDYDGNGVNNSQEYLYGIDPNKISFLISVPNPLVATNIVNATITVLGGVPSSIAVLADSTNFTAAVWSAYTSSNAAISFGTNQGVHEIWVGLKGQQITSQPTWQDVILTLDSASPTISITNPVSNISFNASRVNVLGNFKADSLKKITVNGVPAFINGTNFAALNVPLIARTNKITAVIEKLNGATNTASINIITTTNANGSLNNPIQLQATPVLGMAPLQVTLQVQSNNVPGSIQQRFYDFEGDNIMDQSANNLNSITHNYTNYGEFFPTITVQTKIGSGQSATYAWFSSSGGWNATNSDRVKIRAIQPGITNMFFPGSSVNTNTFFVTFQGYPQVTVSIQVNGTNLNNMTAQTNYADLDTGLIQVPVNLGTNDGIYYVSVGVLNGTNYTWTTRKIVLDRVPPQIVPASCSVTTNLPLLQLTGYATEMLSSITFDVVSSQTTNLNQMGFVVASDGNTFAGVASTNWLQCYDIKLAPGLNTITLRCADLAGNVSTNLYSYTLNTNAMTTPTLSVDWPPNNTVVSGSKATVKGHVSDSAATVVAHVVQTGSTNNIQGVVERDGTFWIDDVPLNSATNLVTLTALNVAGQSATSTVTIQASPVIVAIDPISGDALKGNTAIVSGTIDASGYSITVNGISASVWTNTDGSIHWQATNAPVPAGGTATFRVQAVLNDGDPEINATINKPTFIRMAQYYEDLNTSSFWYHYDLCSCDPPATGCASWAVYHVEQYTQRQQSWAYGTGGSGWDNSYYYGYDQFDRYGPSIYGPAYTSWQWSPSETPANLPWEHCDAGDGVKHYYWYYIYCPEWSNYNSYRRTAQTRVELVVGGRAVPNQPTAVTLKVSAFTNGVPLSPDSITIRGVACVDSGDGINGFVTVTAPAGADTLDVTPLVNTTAESYTFTVTNVIAMAADANRDGEITFDAADATSSDQPFRFWVNNDRDGYSSDLAEYADLDPSSGSGLDANNTSISCTRDLEDYTRLWINTSGVVSELKSGSLLLALEWKEAVESPQIRIFKAAEADGGSLYLTDTTVAQQQISATYASQIVGLNNQQTVASGSQAFIFPASIWANLSDSAPVGHFLFDSVKRGKGKLVVSLYRNNGVTKVVEGPAIYLDLKDVKEMYQRWTVGSNPGSAPATVASLVASSYPYDASIPAANNFILFVHGWNLDQWEKDAFAETAFKRLYWQGYKGHFGAFQWPTGNGFSGNPWDVITDSRNFDNSESNAWASAKGLLGKLTGLNATYAGHIYLLAHSMGNVVAGEALKLAASSRVVNTYVAAQAAIPAHCYDANVPPRTIPYLLESETPNRYAEYSVDGASCYFNAFSGAGIFVNFYNVNDYALGKWIIDQNFKPDNGVSFPGYHYSSSSSFYKITGSIQHNLVFPDNTYEIFAYCDEARSFALGATASVDRFTPQNLPSVWPDDASTTDPNQKYGAHKWHSAEFNFDNMQQGGYWNQLLESYKLKGVQ